MKSHDEIVKAIESIFWVVTFVGYFLASDAEGECPTVDENILSGMRSTVTYSLNLQKVFHKQSFSQFHTILEVRAISSCDSLR
jgi:hypothetical protein